MSGYPPVLETLTVCVMLAVAAFQVREGLFRAWLLFLNVSFAGLLTFDWFEPLARAVGSLGPTWDDYADAVSIAVLFCVLLLALRWVTAYLSPSEPALPPLVRRVGGFLLGLASGYLLAGILLCTVQTLPLPERFLGYDPEIGIGLGSPDRVWLATVHRASGRIFDRPRGQTRWFDADGSFILRYARYRRLPADGVPRRNRGEFPLVLEVVPSFDPCLEPLVPEKLNP